ncbi:hypothetical protein LV82_02562 [Albidovulum inexpectatum]|uniref:site-specific DNA-methyltransferase (adenine-specific) n=1 Tax=Albidovulum inexpectatum TaxID=196587 RepID=A0A2S5JEC7_9RHOB|nr:DNA methyltransferase [Albidovulum inexpectatum]PPB79771.1 hypothetical protein LV82_02562 [Albidovulum inexpectatum]
MRLSWPEVRARAQQFADSWRGESYEKGEAQSFWNDFFQVFGVPRRRVAQFERQVQKLGGGTGFIDLFWKGVMLAEQKSAGRDLAQARQQALDYLDGLKDSELPRYIVLSDFQTFEMLDLETSEETQFSLEQLPDHVEKFGFILGVTPTTFRDEDPVNLEAAELVGRLHDALKDAGYSGHDLERFLVRIAFCLFADDTGIFERNLFVDTLESRTREDGSDTGPLLAQIFQVLNTPEDLRPRNLPADIAAFPYVNGELFAESLRIPSFDGDMREKLLEAARFDWSGISPAIFGALFQSVMDPQARRALGAHYTSEKNILKVIGPLFLDDLRDEFERIRVLKTGRRKRLEEFHARLASMTFFDPACGCGNFLVIAYRELRQLEIDLLKELQAEREDARTLEMDVQFMSRIDVDQFYGIEIEEFPARIAETALWMMDHIMNDRLGREFGKSFARIPLKKSPNIRHADALETDWDDLLPAERCNFLLGNPPFLGAKVQTPAQRAQVRRIARLGGSGGTLDFVAAWFIKAAEYAAKADKAGAAPPRIGFVATSSICQGEQVAQLWPILFGRGGVEISFAHRPFKWGNEARGVAQVHVVIVGLDRRGRAPKDKRLFLYPSITADPQEVSVPVITAYLTDGRRLADPHVVVKEEARPINGMPSIISGSQPIDDGHYILSEEEYRELEASKPAEARWFRPFIGAQEFLNGGRRWIVHPDSIPPAELRRLPGILERIRKVREFRSRSKRKQTLEKAQTPGDFNVTVIPDRPFLVLPEVSSERRDIMPIGWLEPPVIPSNKLRILPDATLAHFALLTSAMHMAWMRLVTGRLKSDYQYGIGIVYNTFPLPPGGLETLATPRIESLAQAVLDARAAHPQATLADLYDPDAMPADLRAAHRALDRAIDRLYRRQGFDTEIERAEHLLALYEAAAATLIRRPRRSRSR